MNEYLVKNGFSEFFIDIANKLFDEFDSLPNAEIAITGNGRGIKMRNRENIKRKYHD
ncbi:MAG: hypothetical protein GWO15_03410 [Nitrosopumilaceae archaeon]|nr:hypothetical protein [Nitrosopumilaceae archaeon]